MFFELTEEDREKFRRARKEQFNALTYRQKISMAMIAHTFSLRESEFLSASNHLRSAINFLFEKIEKEHCLTC